jgi:hypothetical protein
MGLLPRDEAFFALFLEQADRVCAAAEILAQTFRSGSPDWARTAARLDELEHAGDDCEHKTIERLTKSFITPFDPEDIHRLAVALNALLDCLDGLAERCRIYDIGIPPEPMRKLADSIEAAARAARRAVLSLTQERDAPEQLAEIRRLEIEADHVYRKAMLALFQSETDARTLLTSHQLYDGLETATDRFEALSYLIQEIRLKNS